MRKKLRSKKAETLLESLISLLIATLSITLLSTSVMTSARMNKMTRDADAAYAAELAHAEQKDLLVSDNHTITVRFDEGGLGFRTTTVNVFGDGEFISYEKKVTP